MKALITMGLASLLLGVACSGVDGAAEADGNGAETPGSDAETTGTAAMEYNYLPGFASVTTGTATRIGQAHAWLSYTTSFNTSSIVPESECGVCWGPVGSGANYVTEVGANGVRCMRVLGCRYGTFTDAYWTDDGYMKQPPYVPGKTYEYKAYVMYPGDFVYGALRTFSVPKVTTGSADMISNTSARLGVTVDNITSGVTECGVCWNADACLVPGVGYTYCNLDYVEQTTNGTRCMRQTPDGGGCRNAPYFTNDGYMAQRPYELGHTYSYRAYAKSDAGIFYGATKYFSAPRATRRAP
jgi:hypothetical protein